MSTALHTHAVLRAFRLIQHQLVRIFVLCFLLYTIASGSALAALTIECPSSVYEGETFIASIYSDEKLDTVTFEFLGKKCRFKARQENGKFRAWVLLGFGLHEYQEGEFFDLKMETRSGSKVQNLKKTIYRKNKKYEEQRLKVNRKFVELSAKELKRHEQEQFKVKKALNKISPKRHFTLPLLKPVRGRTSSIFGLRRFFNGVAKKPHSGWDIAVAKGTPIQACADGTVVLTGNHFFAGNSVYIDHGHGMISIYMHLSKIKAKTGQFVRRGDTIGNVGATGRVTGPHLHWSVAILGELLDPSLLVAKEE